MYDLYIANKNYSSWSLRPWVLMRELSIPFNERILFFGNLADWDAYRSISPTGKVPCLVDAADVIWDSLSIAEYLAERHSGVWPESASARAWARSAAAEMHSGFGELRSRCAMSCGVRVHLHSVSPNLTRDIARLASLWHDGLRRFGGPFLSGGRFTAVDAFFAPVAFRVQTYGLDLDAASHGYVARLLELSSMQEWYAAGLKETARDLPHEREILAAGTLLQDLRTR